MKPTTLPLKAPKLLQVDVPAELSATDLRSAATALDDLVDDVYANTLSGVDRAALLDVAGWLRRAAKLAEPRDMRDWDAIQVVREEREVRAANQFVSARHGVSEGTVREASFARQIDRSKRRIVR